MRGDATHRPGLDGVRGFAVVVVVAYHLGYLSGGFLGVDLFFVLSGYLITGLALREIAGTGHLGLRAFWGRRARRLIPALLLVVAVCVAAAIALGWPDDQLRSLALDGLSTLTWWANWRQIGGPSYWDAGENLFRHAWSLSIEEQFYVLWPLALAGAAAVAHRLRRPVVAAVGIVAAAGAVASGTWQLVLAHRVADDGLSRVYLGTDTRAVAPLLGCALACLVAAGRPSASVRRAVGLLGAAVLAVLVVRADVAAPDLYRHGWLLVATLASGALVLGADLAEATERNPFARAVTAAGPRYLGTRSYGLYLWSWPVQVLLVLQWPHIARPVLAAATVAITLVVAEASYRLVEQPLRRRTGWASRPSRRRPVWAAEATAAVGVLVVAAVLAVPPPLHERVDTAESAAEALHTGATAPAGVDRSDRSLRVMLTGDSVAWTVGYYLPPAERWPQGIGVIDTRALIGCGLLAAEGWEYPNSAAEGTWINPGGGACQQQVEAERRGLAAHPDVVVLMPGAWEWSDARTPGGHVVRARSPEMADVLGRRLAERIDAANAAGARFVAVAWSCPGDKAADVRRDGAYIRWINGVVQRAVDDAVGRGGRASMLQPNDQVCVGGDPTADPTPAKDEAMDHEVHVVSVAGGTWIWNTWLGPGLRGV